MGSEGESYIVVDVDSDLTKAALIVKRNIKLGVKGVAEANTTIDEPELDVTIGVKEAINRLEEEVGRELWSGTGPKEGYKFLCSSSSSGGLHMVVAGVVSMVSAESAQRAALGAGALLMDVFSIDDSRPRFRKIQDMRKLKPDMFLLAGGTDGGAVRQVIELAELIDESDIHPRFGEGFRLPLIYAGNIEIREEVKEGISDERYAMRYVDNVRPVIESENLGPAREEIYDAYMEQVIIHSPGYDTLLKWVDDKILPTQASIGRIIYDYATSSGVNLVAADVGGATTDVYSVFDGIFNRSLNANIGIKYGISNIMKETGISNLLRWIPPDMGERKTRNIIGNLMVNQPGSLTKEEKLVKLAAIREAIRLGLDKHKEIASRLKGVTITRTIADIFHQSLESTYLDMMNTDVIIGRGYNLSKGYSWNEKTLLMLDAFQPEGVTEMLFDTRSIMPHLGMILVEDRSTAIELMRKACLRRIGTCIAPRGRSKNRKQVMEFTLRTPEEEVKQTLTYGELKTIPLDEDKVAIVEVKTVRGFDLGNGFGKTLSAEVRGGVKGIIIDARGRPLEPDRRELAAEWTEELGLDGDRIFNR
ncbi:MAG: glutamate mutase L [Candidatus Bathyarchaeia archaeon]